MDDKNIPSILLADDVSVIRNSLRRLLEIMGYHDIEEVSNGAEAVKRYAHKRYDLIMLDIDMPKMSGVEALQEIRKIDGSAYIVMVSAHSSAENVKQTISLGVNGFVVKPYSAKKIESIMEKFVRERGFAPVREAGGQ